MTKRQPSAILYLIKGGLAGQRRGIYRLRERQPRAPATETWPKDGEWRSLIHSLMRTPAKEE
jgi:hypothetical protein